MTTSRASAVILAVFDSVWAVVDRVLAFFSNYGWRVAILAYFGVRYTKKIVLEHAARERVRLRKEALDPSRVAALDDRRAAILPGLQQRSEQAAAEDRERCRLERIRLVEEAKEEALRGGVRLGH